MMRIGCAKHKLVIIGQIDETGIALRKLDHERNNPLQYLLQAHVAHHEPAYFLK